MQRVRIPAIVMLAVIGGCTTARAPVPAATPPPNLTPVTPAAAPKSAAAAAVPAPAPAPRTPPPSAAPTASATVAPPPPPGPRAAATPPAKLSAPSPTVAPRPAPAGSAALPPAAAATPAAKPGPPPLDLGSLEQRLRDTHAIGIFTKLSLKNQVDALLEQFRAKHKGASIPTLAELRQRYDLLLMKVLSLLQDDDPTLAQAITSSREAIWGILADPREFAKI